MMQPQLVRRASNSRGVEQPSIFAYRCRNACPRGFGRGTRLIISYFVPPSEVGGFKVIAGKAQSAERISSLYRQSPRAIIGSDVRYGPDSSASDISEVGELLPVHLDERTASGAARRSR